MSVDYWWGFGTGSIISAVLTVLTVAYIQRKTP